MVENGKKNHVIRWPVFYLENWNLAHWLTITIPLWGFYLFFKFWNVIKLWRENYFSNCMSILQSFKLLKTQNPTFLLNENNYSNLEADINFSDEQHNPIIVIDKLRSSLIFLLFQFFEIAQFPVFLKISDLKWGMKTNMALCGGGG